MKEIYPFGDWLQEELKAQKMTQTELALEIETEPSQISVYVSGKQMPRLVTVFKIMEVLGKKLVAVNQEERQEKPNG